MKKFIYIMLVLALVLSMCACGGNGEGSTGESEGLQAGFGRANITPDYDVKLHGGASERTSTGFQDYLYVTCVALKEAGQTYLVYTMDFCIASEQYVAPTEEAISEATGVPVANILMNATHTHASVAVQSDGWTNAQRYRTEFYANAVSAAKQAIADLSPAEIYYGSSDTDASMNFVRHYIMEDGTYGGSNFGDFSSGIAGHTVEADTKMQILQFKRVAEDKKDILLINYPTHATMTQSQTVMSADFPGPLRDYVEANSDSLVAYFIAAAGNQAPSSRVSEEVFSTDYRKYGEKLGEYAVAELGNLTKAEKTGISFKEKTYTTGYNKEKVDQLSEAQAVAAIWETVGRGTDQGKQAAWNHGFSSVYEVSAIISRAQAPATNSMDIKVMAIGDVSFVFAPYEMFGEEGVQIREKSPYDFTFIITCADGSEGYLPNKLGWEIGSYEACVSKYQRGTAEELATEFVKLLTEMKGA